MNVKSGIDALRPEQLKGQKVGLVTNHTGIDRRYRRTATGLKEAGVEVAAIFGPEHGCYGVEQDGISLEEVEKDSWSGVPVYSLYRFNDLQPQEKDSDPFGPPPGSLDGLDAL